MTAKQPSELHELFAEYCNAGDIDGLMSLYEDNACLVAAPGTVAVGTQAVREAFQQFLALKGTIRFVGSEVSFESDDLALTHGRWVMSFEEMVEDIEAMTAEVARLQADGTWRYAIDNPWGTELVAE